ncbi:expressed unknown protein [Seminavis robusta]|uniref:DIX domain-containing protein n=1 Tax=Seminavis robusta TaxID=568900 RepID=A0A9N8EJ86_9STRA|nr:expressed unknown protein [Seminavis robusta]|eukprot:Sro1330_g263370.1 n/a (287) ;mRNA; f:5108-6235
MTTIRYFIPEDGDEEAYPNVFLAAKSRHAGVPPTLGQIRDAFPLPGRYHFRFKSPLFPGGDRDKDAMAVWMDCVKDTAPVPTWRNTIVAKVTRLGMEEEDDEDDDDFVNAGSAAPPAIPHSHSAPAPTRNVSSSAPPQQHAPPPQPAPARAPEPSLDIFGTPSPAAPASSTMPISAPPSTGNLLDGHHPAPAPSSGGLLDMDTPVYGGGQAAASNVHSDFLGMTAPVTTPQQQQTPAFNNQPYGQQQQQQPRQQQQQQSMRQTNQNAFGNFTDQQGPFGGLGTPWK